MTTLKEVILEAILSEKFHISISTILNSYKHMGEGSYDDLNMTNTFIVTRNDT
jgi:hypothetical protein